MTWKADGCFGIVRYRDARRALAWMTTGLGMQERVVVPADLGGITFAVMGLGHDVLASGSLRFGRRMVVSVHGRGVDSHFRRSKAADAQIITEPHDTDYGVRIYAARDLEGHVWSFSDNALPPKPPDKRRSIVVCRGYADPVAAAHWLAETFECELGSEGTDEFRAQLVVGGERVWCVPRAVLEAFGGSVFPPAAVVIYVDDVEEAWQRVTTAGTPVVVPLSEATGPTPRGCLVRDHEGGLWAVCQEGWDDVLCAGTSVEGVEPS